MGGTGSGDRDEGALEEPAHGLAADTGMSAKRCNDSADALWDTCQVTGECSRGRNQSPATSCWNCVTTIGGIWPESWFLPDGSPAFAGRSLEGWVTAGVLMTAVTVGATLQVPTGHFTWALCSVWGTKNVTGQYFTR